jgi:iron complex outermembrane recepter protein
VFAQYTILGSVKGKASQELIEGATISIEDTFIVSSTKSDGSFSIKNLTKGTYILHASYMGFQTSTDTLIIDKNKTIEIVLSENVVLMDEVEVASIRVDDKSAMAYTNINKAQLAEQNLGQDLPYLLNQETSIVTTSDAGAGVGYTGIRIRGSDATRVNVTINGIPVNDAESQGIYWVDLPDVVSSIDNIQIQRGVGTSTNGAGAFGGSVNIQTTGLNTKPYAEYNSSYGSFNTYKNTVNAGSGLINDKFTFDARLSKINSDGFMDRATSDLKSYYLSSAYYGRKTIIKFITFSGYEETYQAWNGVPESRLNGDLQGMNDYINRNGLDAEDAANLLNSSSRTYNQFTYKNQVDHYKQDYYQLHFNHQFNSNWNANIALHYTKGKGYYEEYRKNDAFSNYHIDNVIVGGDTITNTNLVRRLWLDNDFYGTVFSLNYNSNKQLAFTIGGAWNQYHGLHYGEIIWAQYASNSVLHNNYYCDTANKTDFNTFIKANYKMGESVNLFADLQYRTINYSFLGFNSALQNVQQSVSMSFFNPKFGINYSRSDKLNIYASYSIGHHEPNRDDFTQSTPTSRPQAEQLRDIEIGCKYKYKKLMWSLNFFAMQYKNQLVLTGQVNDVGAYTRTNVANSYRQGLEAELAIKLLKKLTWTANATISQNKIEQFEEYYDEYDDLYNVIGQRHNTNFIAASTITFEPIKDLKFSFISKYVGEQFLDNTSNESRKLNPYFVNNIRVNYTIKTKLIRELGFVVSVNNIFNQKYESNGYTYSYAFVGKPVTENYYFPQAGINFMAGLVFKF